MKSYRQKEAEYGHADDKEESSVKSNANQIHNKNAFPSFPRVWRSENFVNQSKTSNAKARNDLTSCIQQCYRKALINNSQYLITDVKQAQKSKVYSRSTKGELMKPITKT